MDKYIKHYHEERNIFLLWESVLSEFNLTPVELKKAVIDIRNELRQRPWTKCRNYSGIDFDNVMKCCGYLRRYASCHSVLVRKSTIDTFLTIPNEITAAILGKGNLKIVSAGGGPGNDILGFISIISRDPRRNFKSLEVTVIDLKLGWKKMFETMIENVSSGKYGATSELFQTVDIHSKFVHADLTKGCPDAVATADVILMTKVLSVVSSSHKDMILWNVLQSMREGAILMFVDVGAERVLRIIEKTPSIYVKILYRTPTMVFEPLYYRYDSLYWSSYEVLMVQKMYHFNNIHTLRWY